ncbi:MAG: hypothetical protein ACLR7U_02020 [Ruthenibacterium lactatiformans]
METRRSLCIGPPGLFTLGVALAVRAVRAVLRVAGFVRAAVLGVAALGVAVPEELVLLEALLALFVLLEDLLLALRAFCVLFSIWSHSLADTIIHREHP